MKRNRFGILPVAFQLAACAPSAACICECGGTGLPGTAEAMPGASLTRQKKVWTYQEMVVGFTPSQSESGWRNANIDNFKETAKSLGITLIFSDRAVKITENEERMDFRMFLADEAVNVIVLDPNELTGWDDLLQQAKDAGKVVILEDRRIDSPPELYSTFVGSDFAEEGRKAGEEMCRLLEDGGEKNIWELSGSAGYTSAAEDRGRGFRETLNRCGLGVVQSETAEWTKAEGKRVMQKWLSESRGVQGIFAHNDDMALGAIEALKEAGLKPGVDVKIVSIDGESAALEAMLAGELNVSVEYSPDLAPQVFEAALKALNGEKLPKFIPVQGAVFSADMPGLEEIAAGRKY
jgi:ABC-type sugar transport system substrate-binding protein